MEETYRYLLEIQYLGTGYRGWQKQENQPDLPTIQGVLEDKIAVITRHTTRICVAGRTDAGVHARQQFAHFDTYKKLEHNKFIYSINSLLKGKESSETISVKSIKPVDNDFHARFSCKQKTYAYYLLPARVRDVFLAWQYWHTPKITNKNEFIKKANECGRYLLGTHDFASFQDADCQAKSSIRTIDNCIFEEKDNMIVMKITARSFLQHQIRITIGTIYEICTKCEKPELMQQILQSCDRKNAGITAPASGLFLEEILY